ncbi:MAG: SsrA-binding protein SmpB [Hyphomicrobiaceae bacterium]|nr:SsrA-binding protein SmpB [Hyphomicrobiaceae bacterium]
MAVKKESQHKAIAENRRARFEYYLENSFEAGLQLTGTEVKSLRKGQANIAESYASIENDGVFLVNANIPEYPQAGPFFQHEPKRPRRLLLHKREIARLAQAVEREGMSLVPIIMYFNNRGTAKIKIAIARGKKLYDKRETSKKRDWNRYKARILRERN